MFLAILFLIVFIPVVIRAVGRKHNAICKSQAKLKGKTALITGGTAGIGLQIALDFAARGARVIIASPFEDEGMNALKKIKSKSGNEDIVYKYLDLASITSIRKFATDINESEKRLHILVNNAGVGIPGDFMTEDGMNFIMQVNYYGHFLLTLLLLPLLKKSGAKSEPSRIINMSSITRVLASFDINNYNKVGYWYRLRIYSNSKISLILFSHELTKKITSHNVVINCADPGFVATKIYESYIVFLGKIARFLIKLFLKNLFEGAQTAIYMAVDHDAGEVSGRIFENCKLIPLPCWKDIDNYSEMLWKQSVKLVLLQEQELKSLLS